MKTVCPPPELPGAPSATIASGHPRAIFPRPVTGSGAVRRRSGSFEVGVSADVGTSELQSVPSPPPTSNCAVSSALPPNPGDRVRFCHDGACSNHNFVAAQNSLISRPSATTQLLAKAELGEIEAESVSRKFIVVNCFQCLLVPPQRPWKVLPP